MNTESIDCRRIDNPRPIGAPPVNPGDFSWGDQREDGRRTLYICLPGLNNLDALPCFNGADRGKEREWAWDGNEEKPTLNPSILFPGHWHGYLRNGRLESC